MVRVVTSKATIDTREAEIQKLGRQVVKPEASHTRSRWCVRACASVRACVGGGGRGHCDGRWCERRKSRILLCRYPSGSATAQHNRLGADFCVRDPQAHSSQLQQEMAACMSCLQQLRALDSAHAPTDALESRAPQSPSGARRSQSAFTSFRELKRSVARGTRTRNDSVAAGLSHFAVSCLMLCIYI